MPLGYEHPSPASLARRLYGTFTSILHTDHAIDETPWDEVPAEIKNSFVEATEMVLAEELETIAAFFEKEVGEQATRKAKEVVASCAPPQKYSGDPVSCYYCQKRPALRWYACADCLS